MLHHFRLPPNPLKLVKDSWLGLEQDSLPTEVGKSVSEHLAELQKKISEIHDIVEPHAKREQEKYVAFYNRKAMPKSFQLQENVIVLMPDTNNKLLARWQGPDTVVQATHPQYAVERNRARYHLHANNLRPYHTSVETNVNPPLVANCAITNEDDDEFGTLLVLMSSMSLRRCQALELRLANWCICLSSKNRNFCKFWIDIQMCFQISQAYAK